MYYNDEGYIVVNDYGTFTHPDGCPAPAWSPWGEIQIKRKPVRGLPIWRVFTAGHGGYMVEATWAASNLSAAAQAVGDLHQCGRWQHTARNYRCYEEDCGWAVLDWEVAALRAKNAAAGESAASYQLRIFQSLAGWHYAYLCQHPQPATLLQGEQPITAAQMLWAGLFDRWDAVYEASRFQEPVGDFISFYAADRDEEIAARRLNKPSRSAEFLLTLRRGGRTVAECHLDVRGEAAAWLAGNLALPTSTLIGGMGGG